MNARQSGRVFRVAGRPHRVRKHQSRRGGADNWNSRGSAAEVGRSGRGIHQPGPAGVSTHRVSGRRSCVRSPDVPLPQGGVSHPRIKTAARTHGARKRTNPPVRGVSVTHGMPRHCASASPTEGSARGRLTAPHPPRPVRRPANRADARRPPKHHRGCRRSRPGAPHTDRSSSRTPQHLAAPRVRRGGLAGHHGRCRAPWRSRSRPAHRAGPPTPPALKRQGLPGPPSVTAVRSFVTFDEGFGGDHRWSTGPSTSAALRQLREVAPGTGIDPSSVRRLIQLPPTRPGRAGA